MVDKEALKARRALAIRDVVLPGGMGTVTVRALTRGEVLAARKRTSDEANLELVLVSTAILDPPMDVQDVAEWFEVAPAGESVAVTEAIRELSGLSEDAAKSGL